MSVDRLFLAPGASGNAERLAPYRSGLAERGLAVETVQLPRGRAERAVAAYRAAVADEELASIAIGGHSFGGRVASLLAAESPPAALVLLSYPLHAPGRHAAWMERTVHWPRIACPVLLLAGEADPFSRLDLLRAAVAALPDAELVSWPKLGHTLGPVVDEALERISAFLAERA